MRLLVTGSSGHLGEALMRSMPGLGHEAVGMDICAGDFTDIIGSITDRALVQDALGGCDAVLHAATLHKPHVATHDRHEFVDVNISGTLTLLESADALGIKRFVFSSTTSTFGDALVPAAGSPAAWIDEAVWPVPKNIYGATKTAAEDLCALFARNHGFGIRVLRLSRFFPEEDDSKTLRDQFSSDNAKANEFLHRRVDLEDAVSACMCALEKTCEQGFGRYIISATTPFRPSDLANLRSRPATVVERCFPQTRDIYAQAGFALPDDISRVYVNERARTELGWVPQWDFARILDQIAAGDPIGSALARDVGIKGYHDTQFEDGPYPLD